MLSYRHAFHAGNHADVLKHFVLLELLRYTLKKDKPFWYIESHAGAGCYSLHSGEAFKTGESVDGIGRLWKKEGVPVGLTPYLEAVAQFNLSGRLLFYPGSPALAMTQLREIDKMRLFELHPADAVLLKQTFSAETDRVHIQVADGLAGLRAVLPPLPRRAVILVDPSYEVKEDYRAVPLALQDAQRRFATGLYTVWYPVLARRESRTLPEQLRKVSEGDWLDIRMEVKGAQHGEAGMVGSGMFILNPPWILPKVLESVMPWLTQQLAQDESAHYQLEYEIR